MGLEAALESARASESVALDLIAELGVEDVPCTCGSGGHQRDCKRHPWAMGLFRAEWNLEASEESLEDMERELESALSGEAAALEEIEQLREENRKLKALHGDSGIRRRQ